MRILRVISSVDSRWGGPVEGLRQISPTLERMGHVTQVVSIDAPDDPWALSFPYPVTALGPHRTGYWYSPRLVPWLRRHAGEFDCVVVHGLWQHISRGAWAALRGGPTPYFVYTHGMLDPWFKRQYPLKHLKKTAYWRWGEYRALRDARAVFFTCEEEKLLARQSFRPYRCREVVVNYGTSGPSGDPEAQRAAFFEAFPELRGRRLILFLSRIHEKKGCDLLIQAFAAVAASDPKLHLVMAGPDQAGWQPALQQQAETLGVAERIAWAGMLSGDRKWGAFRAAEVFALPSHQENFGIAVAEALACGLPVLISNRVNIWREIAADNAGLTADDTAEGTRHLLQEWLALPAEARAAMRGNAARCFAQRFEIERAAQSFLDAVCAHGVRG